ncbi:hypothetical protein [Blastococcus montanus]|uniref:hypothetical protein n=1 Tax=Blastococcus montanus TaxID=3144973 RepID=UPI00387E9BCC
MSRRAVLTDAQWERISEVLPDAAGDIDWSASIDSTINRAHQRAASLSRDTGAPTNYTNPLVEPAGHALGRSRGGLSTKVAPCL